jgi:lipoprotein-anchoring transpeptidase ErfK/SrfK
MSAPLETRSLTPTFSHPGDRARNDAGSAAGETWLAGAPRQASRFDRLRYRLIALANRWPGLLWRLRPAEPPACGSRGEPVSIVVSLSQHRLYLYGHGSVRRSFRVAIGGWRARTPRGEFSVGAALRDPVWCVPNRPERYGALAGLAVPAGDPRHQIGPRWMQLTGSIGIHGGPDGPSRWTSGCVQMGDAELVELFDLAPSGTPVLIV